MHRQRPPQPQPLRIAYPDVHALLEGFARAQDQTWVDDCVADVGEGVLFVRPLGGLAAHPQAIRSLGGRPLR